MTFLRVSLLTLVKDDASLSVIKSIYQRGRFLEASLLVNTYNDRAEEDALEKCHLLHFLTRKKRHYFSFFL